MKIEDNSHKIYSIAIEISDGINEVKDDVIFTTSEVSVLAISNIFDFIKNNSLNLDYFTEKKDVFSRVLEMLFLTFSLSDFNIFLITTFISTSP